MVPELGFVEALVPKDGSKGLYASFTYPTNIYWGPFYIPGAENTTDPLHTFFSEFRIQRQVCIR